MRRQSVVVALVAVVTLTTGCAAVPGGGPGPEPLDPPATAALDGEECGISYLSIDERGTDGSVEPLRVSFQTTGAVDGFLVARGPDGVLGVERVEYDANRPVAADGVPIELDRSFSGRRAVRVTAHVDADGDDRFDPGTDPPCTHEGSVVRTETATVRGSGSAGVEAVR